MSGIVETPIHVESVGDGLKSFDELRLVEREAVFGKADAHEVCAVMQAGRVLIGLEDVPTMLKDKLRDSRDNSWLVGT